jgi:hypothetical protein
MREVNALRWTAVRFTSFVGYAHSASLMHLRSLVLSVFTHSYVDDYCDGYCDGYCEANYMRVIEDFIALRGVLAIVMSNMLPSWLGSHILDDQS